MEDDYNQGKSSEHLALFFVFIVLSALSLILMRPITPLIDFYPQRQSPTTMKEGINMGKQDKDHEDLISLVREDLKLNPSLYIKIFIGPYQDITGEGIIISLINPPSVVILLDKDFYKTLTTEERTALVAHELGHLTNEAMLTFLPSTLIKFQIEADTYATRFADPSAMISVLNKIITRHGGVKPEEYGARIENLEKIKQSQQAH